MIVHLSGTYLATDSTEILWLHGRLQKRANGNVHLIQFPDEDGRVNYRNYIWMISESADSSRECKGERTLTGLVVVDASRGLAVRHLVEGGGARCL